LVWTIKYTDTARTLLRKIDKQTARTIVNYMGDSISVLEDPRQQGKALKGPLGGLWRYQVGDFRIICDIQDGDLCILVVKIGNRRDVYR
jgi:mRNA interferase RelE/StbE